MNKTEARASILGKRKNRNNLNASKACFDALILSKLLNSFTKIGIYYPIGNEINIMPLVDEFPNKKFYLPSTGKNLSFHEYKKELKPGPFKTMEATGDIINRDDIECFIIPCVGISKDLRRLGYGRGYYDRYMEGYKGLKIGIAYKEDSNLDIKLNEYDLKLDYIIVG